MRTRAQFLLDHLSPAYRSVLQLIRLPTPLTLPVCSIALVVGFTTNLLGSAENIHIARNPVLLLVAWNLFVYLVLFLLLVTTLQKKRRASSSSPEPMGAKNPATSTRAAVPEATLYVPRLTQVLMPGLWHLFHRVALSVGERKRLADVVRRFSVNWSQGLP